MNETRKDPWGANNPVYWEGYSKEEIEKCPINDPILREIIYEGFYRYGRIHVEDIVEGFQYPAGYVHDAINTLVRKGFIRKGADGAYKPKRG